MPTQNDAVTVMIGGKVHQHWKNYDLESDMLTPSDAWHVDLGINASSLPDFMEPWTPVEIKVGNDTVLVGRIDDITDSVRKDEHILTMSGRDHAAVLVDCSAPIFSSRLVTLQEVVAKIVRPLGITRIRIDAESTYTREKISVEPCDTAWDVLQHAAEANGLWPWFTPDGTLVVGGPDYDTPPVATLVMNLNGKGNNLLSLSRRRSIIDRYSEVTVLGQTHGTETETGKHALKATAKDKSVSWYRPNITVDHEADNTAICRDRSRKLLSDSRLGAFELIAEVKGHRVSDNGVLWTPGQRVQVISEAHGINGIYFMTSRRFTRGRDGFSGTRTSMVLKEDGLWTLDAHPHQRKHRRGRNSAPGAIINVG